MTEQEYYLLLVIIPFLLLQSILLFIDAKKKQRNAWFWGIWGLINIPTPAILYLLLIVIPAKRKTKKVRE